MKHSHSAGFSTPMIPVFRYSHIRMSYRNLIYLGCGLFVVLVLHVIIQHQDSELDFTHSRIAGKYKTPLLRIRLKHASSKESTIRSQQSSIDMIRLKEVSPGELLGENLTHPAVLLIHGLSASKSIMTLLGSELARWGLDCYLVDLPGHGESTERFSVESCQPAIHEALQDLKRNALGGPKLGHQPALSQPILIGHSLGAGLAIKAARAEPEIAGVIAISPPGEVINSLSPKNLLILLGEFDLPFVRKGAAFMFEQGTEISLPLLNTPGTWQNLEGSRKLVVLPWTEHTLGIFESQSLLEMANWLKRFYPEIRFDPRRTGIHVLPKFLFCICLLLLFIPAFNLLYDLIQVLRRWTSVKAWPDLAILPARICHRPGAEETDGFLEVIMRRLRGRGLPGLHATSPHAGALDEKCGLGDWQPTPPNQPVQPNKISSQLFNISTLWVYGLAGTFAAFILLWVNPWEQLNLLAGGYLSGFFFLTGLLAFCFKRPKADCLRISAADLIFVLLAVSLLVLLAAPFFSKNFVHATLSQERVWRFPIIALSLFPFYLFDEWACRRSIRFSRRADLVFFHLSNRLSLALILLLGFFVLQNTQFLIILVLSGLLGLSILCWCYAGLIYHRTRSILASALFSTLVTGWFFSTFFVQV